MSKCILKCSLVQCIRSREMTTLTTQIIGPLHSKDIRKSKNCKQGQRPPAGGISRVLLCVEFKYIHYRPTKPDRLLNTNQQSHKLFGSADRGLPIATSAAIDRRSGVGSSLKSNIYHGRQALQKRFLLRFYGFPA